MKQKSLILVVVVSVLSVIVATVLSNVIFSHTGSRVLTAEVVDPISPDFKQPPNDSKYFNSNSIDPTQIIRIAQNANQTPFSQSQTP